MKNLKNLFFLALVVLFIPACTIEVVDDETPTPTNVSVNNVDGGQYIYQEVLVEGSGFSTDCTDHSMSIVQDGNIVELEILRCSAEEVVGFIPIDVEPGAYTLELTLNGASFEPSGFVASDFDFDIKLRPVILTLSSTTITTGDILIATGKHFLNPTDLDVYDPSAWVSATGFSFQTNPVSTNDDGTEAEITITNNIPAGEYVLKIVSREFGNEIPVTVTE